MVSKQKILIVDDDNNIAELISLYLTKECYGHHDCEWTENPALILPWKRFAPNLILLDIDASRHRRLSGMQGSQGKIFRAYYHAFCQGRGFR